MLDLTPGKSLYVVGTDGIVMVYGDSADQKAHKLANKFLLPKKSKSIESFKSPFEMDAFYMPLDERIPNMQPIIEHSDFRSYRDIKLNVRLTSDFLKALKELTKILSDETEFGVLLKFHDNSPPIISEYDDKEASLLNGKILLKVFTELHKLSENKTIAVHTRGYNSRIRFIVENRKREPGRYYIIMAPLRRND